MRNDNKPDYPFIFDYYGGPYTSASCIISTRSLLNGLGSKLINRKWEKSFWLRWPHLVVNNLLNDLFMLWQHEVDGHGFRQRSFNKQVLGYRLRISLDSECTILFFPFVSLRGDTRWYGDLNPLVDMELLRTIAGSEANTVLASEMVLKNFKNGKLDYRDYNLFCKAFTDLLIYLIGTDSSDSGDDIANYLKQINSKYSSGNLSLTGLQSGAIVFLMNPILYKAIWSFYAYVFKNKRETSIPYLRWDSITYMPIIRMGLTPFGMSYYLDNYIGYQSRTMLVSLQAGKIPSQSGYHGGIGCTTAGLYQYKRYALDLTANLWHQPALLLNDTDVIKDGNHWGGMLGTHHKFQINDFFSLQGSVLYKSAGFIEGVVAQGGFIWQAGVSFTRPLA